MKTGEHRKVNRTFCSVPVEGRAGGDFYDVHTVDISHGGIGFVSAKPVAIHKKIAVEVELGPGNDPIVMMGEVRWIRPCYKSKGYRIGMKFVKVISAGSRSRLTQYFGD